MTPNIKSPYGGLRSEFAMNNFLCPFYLRESQVSLQRTCGISESKLSQPTSDYSEAFERSNKGRSPSPDLSRNRKLGKNPLYRLGRYRKLRKSN